MPNFEAFNQIDRVGENIDAKNEQIARSLDDLRQNWDGEILAKNSPGFAGRRADGKFVFMRPVVEGDNTNFVAFRSDQLPEEGVYLSATEMQVRGDEVLKSL